MFQKSQYHSINSDPKIIHLLYTSISCNFQGFQAHFQPIYNVRTNRIIGAEALMRFHSEEYGFISPSDFIPILEETELIIPAGQWILHKALSFCHEVQKYIPDFKISINLSSIQISHGNISAQILEALEKYHINHRSIISELTESRFLETDSRFSNICDNLKKAGISLALDDFGTGYSNFRYISDLNPNIIKIDHSFTQKALHNHRNYELLFFFCEMMHKLNLEVCIEGIENQEAMREIRKMNPDYIQGFYLGRPCPCPQFMKQFVFTQPMEKKPSYPVS